MIEISGGRIRRRDKRIWFLLLGVFAAVSLFTFLSKYHGVSEADVEAASLGNFDPGYIISDYQMGNYTSMSEAEIQQFLTSKNSCPNRDYAYYQKLSANKNYTWHWANDHFICLSEEKFGDGEVIGSGDTAAHIIWQAAQDYKINPKVLIVLLQKETGLITDPIPNNGDYRKATGYGCPDTAACSSKYYGFKNQIRNAASMYRTVLDGGWTNYPLGNNYVQYNPNAACGGSIVNIKSLATSALYRYTPYQPNAGAIAAGYGTAPCGAYGNRNFYLYFQDWFGGITIQNNFVSLENPRYFMVKKEVNRIDPFTGEVIDKLQAGTIRKFDSKIEISSGKWCLRTEYTTKAKTNECVLLSDLNEVELVYTNISEEKVIKSGAKKIELRTDKKTMNFSENMIRKFVKKVVFQDKTYYITEYDSKFEGAEYGIASDDLTDAYKKMAVKEYALKETTNRVNPLNGAFYDTLEKGRIIKFAAEITINGKKYYQTEHNNLNKIDAAVPADKLVEVKYEALEKPREMVIKERVNRINPFSGEVYDTLEKGRVIKFVSKIKINDKWYYRTEHNSIYGIHAVVPESAIGETS